MAMFWRGVWGYLPANIVQGVVGFLTIVIFTRLLTPEDFGRYALAFSVMTLAHVAVFTWLEAAMARFWAAQASEPSMRAHFASLYRAFWIVAAIFIPAAIAVVVFWPGDGLMKWALAVGLAGCPIRCLVRLVQERNRAAGEVARAARLDMGVAIGGLVIGVGFALAGAGATAPLAGLALAPLAALPFVLGGELSRTRGGEIERDRLTDYARYGYPIAVSLALGVVLSSTDRFLLAAFLDEAAVGAYHAAYSIANRTLDVMFIWLGAAGTPALIMALERGGKARLQEAAREQASLFILLGLPCAVGVALVARPLADVLIGQDLRTAVAQVTPWVAVGALLSGITTYYFSQAFTLGRRTTRLLLPMGVTAGVNVLLNLVLIPRYGVQGAAIATAASLAIGVLASIGFGRRVIAMPVPWEALARCGVAAGVMALAVIQIPAWGGFLELIVKAGVGAVVYGAVAMTINAGGVRDLALRFRASRRRVTA